MKVLPIFRVFKKYMGILGGNLCIQAPFGRENGSSVVPFFLLFFISFFFSTRVSSSFSMWPFLSQPSVASLFLLFSFLPRGLSSFSPSPFLFLSTFNPVILFLPLPPFPFHPQPFVPPSPRHPSSLPSSAFLLFFLNPSLLHSSLSLFPLVSHLS